MELNPLRAAKEKAGLRLLILSPSLSIFVYS